MATITRFHEFPIEELASLITAVGFTLHSNPTIKSAQSADDMTRATINSLSYLSDELHAEFYHRRQITEKK